MRINEIFGLFGKPKNSFGYFQGSQRPRLASPTGSDALHATAEKWQKAYQDFAAGTGPDPGPLPLDDEQLRRVNWERKYKLGQPMNPINRPPPPTPPSKRSIPAGTTIPVGGVEYVYTGTEWRDSTTGKPATPAIEAAIRAALGF